MPEGGRSRSDHSLRASIPTSSSRMGWPCSTPTTETFAIGNEGAEANLIDIPGDGPLPDDQRNVPHGTVHMHWYQSSVGLGQRRFLLYTPPGYSADRNTRYPLVVLLHGSG